jgi:hypothetical protein
MEVAASLKEARLPKGFERVCDQMRVALRAIRVRRGPWTTEEATKATLTDALPRCESLPGQLRGVVRIADVLARVDPPALSEIGLPGTLISRKTAVRSRINTGWLRDRAATPRANMTFASQACRHAHSARRRRRRGYRVVAARRLSARLLGSVDRGNRAPARPRRHILPRSTSDRGHPRWCRRGHRCPGRTSPGLRRPNGVGSVLYFVAIPSISPTSRSLVPPWLRW